MSSFKKCFVISLGLSLGMSVALPPVAYAVAAKTTAQRVAQVKAILKANPNGGEALVAALAKLVTADPASASVVAQLAAEAGPSQQSAMGAALGCAVAQLGNNPEAAAAVAAAAEGGPPAFQASFGSERNATLASLNPGGGGDAGAGPGSGSQFVLTPTTSGGGSGSGSVSGQ